MELVSSKTSCLTFDAIKAAILACLFYSLSPCVGESIMLFMFFEQTQGDQKMGETIVAQTASKQKNAKISTSKLHLKVQNICIKPLVKTRYLEPTGRSLPESAFRCSTLGYAPGLTNKY